ncbi:MAG: hypothetical protein ACK4E0_15140 [Chitinophagaceae bacterium]
MNHYLILASAVILASCGESRSPGLSDQTKTDTINTASKLPNDYEKELLVERGNFEDERYKMVAYSQFIIPDKISHDSSFYLKRNLLQVSEKKTNKTFHFQLTDPCSSESKILISDVTRSLRFTEPVFQLATPDCSDWYINEFVVIKDNSIQKIFAIGGSEPVQLERRDEVTLAGAVKDRDEILGFFQDYPISVSLKDFKVAIKKPVKQSIGVLTEALETFQLSGFDTKHSFQLYTLKKGEKLFVDSLFRDTKQVRLIVKDSIPIYCPITEIKGKIQGNTAG